MGKYEVDVTMEKVETVVVEAVDADTAVFLAIGVAKCRNLDLSQADEVAVEATEADDDARLSTYTCVYCKTQSAKELWGPGRTLCPACGRRAPTAEEHHAMERAAEAARAVAGGRAQADDGGA